jgi:hypothetical protein
MPSPRHTRVRLAAAVGLLLLAALSSGQTVEAQRPSTAYYEVGGMWCGLYDIDPGRARMAVLAALANMHMLVGQEGFFPYESFVDTKTVDNYEVRITIRWLGRQGTQIGARVGGWGTHRQVCARLLDEIGRNMDAARQAPLRPPSPPAPPAAPPEDPAAVRPVPKDRPPADSEHQQEIGQHLRQLSDANEGTRIDAVTQLGRMHVMGAIDPLAATLAGDQSPAVREAAAHSLGLIASPKALPALNRAIQSDPDHDVRKAAEFAVEIIQSREHR